MSYLTHYKFSVENPHQHIVKVQATFTGCDPDSPIEVMIPSWTPGSYKIRNYVQHVHHLRVTDSPDGNAVPYEKTSMTSWKIGSGGLTEVHLSYEVYAHEMGQLNPRQSHVSPDFVLLHMPNLLIAPMTHRSESVRVEVFMPKDWDIYCGLSKDGKGTVTEADYLSDSIDRLYDAPVYAGKLHRYEFQVEDVPHAVVINESLSDLAVSEDQFLDDLTHFVKGNFDVFGHFPYKHYQFFLMIAKSGGGGIEHHNSSTNLFPRGRILAAGLKAPYEDTKYLDLYELLAHENFHAWNIKEFGPEALARPDYSKTADTSEIWTVEGFASYYEKRALICSRVIKPEAYLALLVKDIKRYEEQPSRLEQSLEDSGRDNWIKFYCPHENNVNTMMSYYLKGSLLCVLFDLEILLRSEGKYRLSDVLKEVSKTYSNIMEGDPGYPKGTFEALASQITGSSFKQFFDDYVRGTTPVPFDDYFEKIGCRVKRKTKAHPTLGIKLSRSPSDLTIKGVLAGSIAADHDIAPGDMIVALNHRAVSVRDFKDVIKNFAVFNQGPLVIHYLRNGMLKETSVELRTQETDVIKEIEILDDVDDKTLEFRENFFTRA